jgi:murein DD-endopeptidase MepM/ murein hydrolase activator NlpD
MRGLRLLLAGAVLVTATGFALRGAWPWPRLRAAPPIVVSTAYHDTADTLRSGETLGQLFQRQGLVSLDLARVVGDLGLDPRRLRAGLIFHVRRPVGEAEPTRVTVRTGDEVRLRMERVDDAWQLERETILWEVESVRVAGDIGSSLYTALDRHVPVGLLGRGERVRLAWDLADVYAWSVDFTRDIQTGDRFNVLLERRISEEGEVRYGRVLAAELVVAGRTLTAYRFDREGLTGFYDASGRSLRRAFLRAPVQFRRITSTPSSARFHPVLRVTRRHAGTDYAAAPGTPVMAAGNGTVTRAGWAGGYGILVEIRHQNGITTRYAHLQGVARGLRPGVRVSQSDVIGYVGSTGLSTGPHLHYEFLVNGVPQDPGRLVGMEGPPIEPAHRPAFELVRETYARRLAEPVRRPLVTGD